jgi:cardiolipin synthase
MDMRSFRLNFEVHALVHDRVTAQTLHGAFEAALTKSRRVDLNAWQERSTMLKVKEGASRLVSPLL